MEYCLYRSSTGSWNVSTIFKLELIFIITFWFISNLRFILSKVTVHWDTCLIILFNFSTACIITCARFYLQKCYENKLEWAFCLKFIFRIKEGMGAVMMKMKKKLTLIFLEDITAYISGIFNSGKTAFESSLQRKKGHIWGLLFAEMLSEWVRVRIFIPSVSTFQTFFCFENNEIRMKFINSEIYAAYRIFECLFLPSFSSIRLTILFIFRITTFVPSLTLKINLK